MASIFPGNVFYNQPRRTAYNGSIGGGGAGGGIGVGMGAPVPQRQYQIGDVGPTGSTYMGAIPPQTGAPSPSITGAAPSNYNPASGGIPGVTDPSVSLRNLIATLTNQAPNIANLTNTLTDASAGALRNQYSGAIPSFYPSLEAAGQNTADLLSGETYRRLFEPEVNRVSAENAVARGVSGSGAAETAREVGAGQQQFALQQQGLANLNQLRAATPVVQPFDLGRITPDINTQMQLQQLADTLRAAGVPEEVFQRTLQLAQAGIAQGRRGGGGAVYGAGSPNYRSSGGGTGAGGATSITDQIMRQYGGRIGAGPTGSIVPGGASSNPYFGSSPWDVPYNYNVDPSAYAGSQWLTPGQPGYTPPTGPSWDASTNNFLDQFAIDYPDFYE